MTLFQLIRAIRWLQSVDGPPQGATMTPSAEQVRIEGDHRPPAQRPTSVGVRKRVSWPAQPTSTRR
jgi:hypothetical protein